LLLCSSDNADYTIVNGRVIVREGQLNSIDIIKLVEKHNKLAIELAKISH
jgi:hypothetical protein